VPAPAVAHRHGQALLEERAWVAELSRHEMDQLVVVAGLGGVHLGRGGERHPHAVVARAGGDFLGRPVAVVLRVLGHARAEEPLERHHALLDLLRVHLPSAAVEGEVRGLGGEDESGEGSGLRRCGRQPDRDGSELLAHVWL